MNECKIIEFSKREKRIFSDTIRWFKKNFELRNMKIAVYPLDRSHQCYALTSSEDGRKVDIFIKPGLKPDHFREVFTHEMLHIALHVLCESYRGYHKKGTTKSDYLLLKNRWRVLDEKLTCMLTRFVSLNRRRAARLADIGSMYYEEERWN